MLCTHSSICRCNKKSVYRDAHAFEVCDGIIVDDPQHSIVVAEARSFAFDISLSAMHM